MTATIALLDPARSRRTIAKATKRIFATGAVSSASLVFDPFRDVSRETPVRRLTPF